MVMGSCSSSAAQPGRVDRRGSWITFPFIIATVAGLTMSAGWVTNLITCLKEEFNMKDIDATKVYNYVNGSITVFPIVGAVIADSFLGCFSVICFSSIISLLGIVLLVLTAALNQLRPPTCSEKGSQHCEYPSQFQFAILYLSLALASLGTAFSRFTIATMGANQLHSPKHQAIFFNWYIFAMYIANLVSATATVYVEENVGWTWGFGLCAVANVLGLVVFLSGTRFYCFVERKGSPFKSLACVVVAAISKRKMVLPVESENYYHGLHGDAIKTVAKPPTQFFRFLNHAALRTEGETTPDGSITSPWRLCTVQQVEDLKALIKILPIWLSGLILSIPIAIQLSFIIFQAKTMDARLGSHFKIPAASMQVFTLISTSITIVITDRILFPLWEKLAAHPLTALQRVGIGHLFTILSMAISGAVESKRLKIAKSENVQNQTNGSVIPMSVFWLAPQLTAVGVAEAFHFAGQVAFYYQEFPGSLKTISTAAVAVSIGGAFYLSNAVIDVIEQATKWLPENINDGRLDNVYWLCSTLGALNFAYFIVCATFYKYQDVDNVVDDSNRN
ncbi:UNVERIFIED_CONTAM: protein NRT1/ PTR FAMILY 2.7 [Sesamum radiatum]|uniref:Protein NRT1/ PTR FAMILY 2.7 n=1 Tax=Sesamum radiatum TaxID=300843 RepID=A0AAW2UN32_SESRA